MRHVLTIVHHCCWLITCDFLLMLMKVNEIWAFSYVMFFLLICYFVSVEVNKNVLLTIFCFPILIYLFSICLSSTMWFHCFISSTLIFLRTIEYKHIFPFPYMFLLKLIFHTCLFVAQSICFGKIRIDFCCCRNTFKVTYCNT